MKLEKVITLANEVTKHHLLGMERSLRATGCQLPIWVIPYDNRRFDLPEGSVWWDMEEVTTWLDGYKAWPACRKYQCFLTDNYQYVDADVLFLRNPEEVLSTSSGFITSCMHWQSPGHTYTPESLNYMKEKTTIWQSSVFNSGQFACESALYDWDSLKKVCEGEFKNTLLLQTNQYKDQPAINLLTQLSGVKVTNLTLPPQNMQSTWVGDYYWKEDYSKYWKDQNSTPYLLHWAGRQIREENPLGRKFLSYLSSIEQEEYRVRLEKKERGQRKKQWLFHLKKKVKQIIGRQ